MAGHHATSSGLESTETLLFSLPSDASDVQTEITPPTSPTLSEGKMRTPRDILDASRRLGQISALALQGETPTKLPKHFHHRESTTNDEAGYDADGDADGDGDGDGDEVRGSRARARAGTTTTTGPVRRPTFLRIDTRQHRRVASMLATRRPTSPDFGDMDIPRPPRAKLAALPSIRLKSTAPATNAESYELRRRQPVGLGIGFPENHPLRSRAFTTPVPASVSPVAGPGLEDEGNAIRWSEWLPSRSPTKSKKKTTQIAVYAPSPVPLVLRPTFLEVSPSPIDYLPAQAGGAGTFRCDDAYDRSEIERQRYRRALAREGRPELDLSEPMVMLPRAVARSEVMLTFDVGSRPASFQRVP